jgi:YD repeat-containing protein
VHLIDSTSEAPPRDPYTRRFFYDASGNLIYEAWAPASQGAATSAAVWVIRRHTYDTSSRLTASEWADGNSLPDNVLDNRAALNYQ